MPRGPRIALVHDYLLVRRGAERTFGVMAELWPEAWVFALLYDEAVARSLVRMRGVHSSYLQGIGARHSPFRYAWHERSRALEEVPIAFRPALRATLARIRSWDRAAAQRVDHYIAN